MSCNFSPLTVLMMPKLSGCLAIALLLSSPVSAIAQPPSLAPIAPTEAHQSQAAAQLKRATMLLQQNQFLPARQSAEQAVNLYRVSRDTQGQQQALTLLAMVFYRQGNHRQALQTLNQAAGLATAGPQRHRLLS